MGKVIPASPAPAGAHTKMPVIINPTTKGALFNIVDRLFILKPNLLKILRCRNAFVNQGVKKIF
jgi:hypothetical protein